MRQHQSSTCNRKFKQISIPDVARAKATLTSILTYHVLAGRVFSTDLVEYSMPPTLNGEKVTITLNGGAKVKGLKNTSASTISAADMLASNGVIHVIDQVLLP